MAKAETELVDIVSKFVNDNGYLPMLSELSRLKLAQKWDFKDFGGYGNFSDKHFNGMKRRFGTGIYSEEQKESMKNEFLSLIDIEEKITTKMFNKMDKNGEVSFSYRKLQNAFGSWNEFLKYCGVITTRGSIQKYSDEEVKNIFLNHYKDDIPTVMKLDFDFKNRLFLWSSSMIEHRFGSYNKFMELCGEIPNSVGCIYSKQYIANDGHVCNSYAEKTIDDFLHRNKIKHEREVSYKDIGIETDRRYRSDWIIDNSLVVEFCGIMNKEAYSNKMREKEKLLIESGVDYLFIDYTNIDDIRHLLKKYITRTRKAVLYG